MSSFFKSFKRHTDIYFRALLYLVWIIGIYLLSIELLADINSAVQQDADHYLLIGNAITKGLKPYTDLYDHKSLGIFYIFALSFLFGGLFLVKAFYFAAYFLIPFLKPKYPLLIILSFFGSIATFGSLQPEAFGAIFGALFICNSLHRNNRYAGAILILLTCWMKEPFIFSLIGGYLLTERPIKELLYQLFYAFIIGLTIVLILNVSYHKYVLIQLLEGRIHGSEPLWIRGFYVRAIIERFNDGIPFFGWVLAILWIFRTGWKFFLGGLLMHFFLVNYRVIQIIGFSTDSFYIFALSTYLIILGFFLWKAEKVTFINILVLYLLMLSCTVSSGTPLHHVVMTFPILFELIVTSNKKVILILTAITLLFVSPHQVIQVNNEYTNSELDTIMDNCDIERYAGTVFYPLNDHLPSGALVSWAGYTNMKSDNPLVEETEERAKQAGIVLITQPWFFEFDLSNHTTTPPLCANIEEKEGWWYRNDIK